MSQRSEDDAERTACLVAITQHLRFGNQCLVVDGIDAGQLGCTVLLKQSANFCGMSLSGLVRKDGSDLFEGQFGFSRRSIVMGFVSRSGAEHLCQGVATSLIVAAAVRRSLIASSNSLILPIDVASFLDLLLLE